MKHFNSVDCQSYYGINEKNECKNKSFTNLLRVKMAKQLEESSEKLPLVCQWILSCDTKPQAAEETE